jgi:hypothetical protein
VIAGDILRSVAKASLLTGVVFHLKSQKFW